jgi:hypothetical protein
VCRALLLCCQADSGSQQFVCLPLATLPLLSSTLYLPSQVAQQRYDAVVKGQPERLVSGSDDHTMFLWTPSTSKSHVARMTGHVQLINQVGAIRVAYIAVCCVCW